MDEFRNRHLQARAVVVVVMAGLLVAGCISSGGGKPEAETAATTPTIGPTGTPGLAEIPPSDNPTLWRCGDLKHEVLLLAENLNTLITEIDTTIKEQGDITDDDVGVLMLGLRYELEDFQGGFTSADQTALNLACRLQGQHAAAVELWSEGNRGDACDVWRPAATEMDVGVEQVDIAALHPVVSRVWAVATGEVAEGSGRCLAELAN